MPEEAQPRDAATPVVSAFYDRFPYPGDPLQDGPPPGYNWRWCVNSAWAMALGCLPPAPAGEPRPWRILDAGCGTGVSTDYLCHLNPGASVLAVDISGGTLEVARERTRRSGAAAQVRELRIEQRSLLELQGEGPFDYINSVGVLHHLREPQAGLRALADRLAPGGVLHLFLYADGGRREIHRIQRALSLMGVGTGAEGLRLGRQLFCELPEANRLRRHHQQRWALDTAADANFADMYLHPQETSYDIPRLMAFVASADLQFAGFSNPEIWDPARLLGGELLERARHQPLRVFPQLRGAPAPPLGRRRPAAGRRLRAQPLPVGLAIGEPAGPRSDAAGSGGGRSAPGRSGRLPSGSVPGGPAAGDGPGGALPAGPAADRAAGALACAGLSPPGSQC
jgi:SAM-dependent methyltransferase